MTMSDIYIGDLDDPEFRWDGGDSNGNIPARLSPYFPPRGFHAPYNAHFFAWLRSNPAVEWKQTDFGGWVAKVTKRQIFEFIRFTYGTDPSYTDSEKTLRWRGEAYLVDNLDGLTRFALALDPKKTYALVATEF
jgi:hypothetical protein